ncbi:hypothetical protein GCM10023156_53040 [Novipirellula rosea]|uniref:AP2 domain protein n=1 Tax=Novipirellula rosea TaxID=1031540 RepID=A0ABP8NH72_9BACT
MADGTPQFVAKFRGRTLGTFSDPYGAARAHDDFARAAGAYRRLNFPKAADRHAANDADDAQDPLPNVHMPADQRQRLQREWYERNHPIAQQYIGVIARHDQTRFRVNYKKKHIGNFASVEDAARAYDEAARASGQIENLNFPAP